MSGHGRPLSLSPDKPRPKVDYSNTPRNGEVRITKPADPERVAAWRASKEGQRRTTKQWGKKGYL